MSSLPIINPDDLIPGGADNRWENRDTRLRWIPFTKTSVVRGEEVVSFPFLENNNLKDLLLVRLLLVERPYKAAYGATIKACDGIALQLRNEKHPETGELLFGHKGIKGKAIKERFLACMEFVKQQDREALRCTGTNDEPEPGEILNALEDLCSDWQSHCALGDTKSSSIAAQKKKDKDAAEAMRQASLGSLTAIYGRNKISDLDADGVLQETAPAVRRLSYASRASSTTTSRSRSPVFSPGQHTEAIQDLITSSKEQEEEQARSKHAQIEQEKVKEERENCRLTLEEARLQLDSERLEIKQAELTASMQFMQALAQSLLNQNKNNNNHSNNN
jgi:hypothetical protein